MDQSKKQLIKKNKIKLVQWLGLNRNLVLQHVHSETIITDDGSRPSTTDVSADFDSPRPVSAPSRHPIPRQNFFSKHKAALETRLPSVLASILIPLQERQVLNQLERELVESKSIRVERNNVLLTMIQNKGSTAQMEFYNVLKEADPTLVKNLENTPES
ncbi:caspase recruitment domain-containing protein 8-like [Alosa pseudoharengus]|uniref:caspase recruitment domain-containing protein 8-like n=1 Tax=Alosa pseudoharengus TaxID=34774 RepID=UPI003F89AF4B